MKITLDIEQSEINRMARQIRAWQVKKRAELLVLIEETTDKIYDDARDDVPVRTGDLKKSIKKSINVLDMQGEVTVEKFYGRFVEIEYGGVHRPATPFLRPAFEKHIPGFIAGLKRILQKV